MISLKITERSTIMASMYSSGMTLNEIGCEYGLTHERVRQIIKPHNLVIENCGGSLRAKGKLKFEAENKKYAHFCKYGCSINQRRTLRGVTGNPIMKFKQQKANAATRDIVWDFKLWEWWQVWVKSGKWDDRGLYQYGYVMARFNDVGPY